MDAAWPDVEVAYSYKTNRLPAILRALAAEGAGHEVVCEAEYALARDAIGAAGPDVIVNGPVKSDALLERAAADGALVVVDSEPELERAARAGVERVGLRVALPGHRRRADALRHRARAWCPTPPPTLARSACELEALSAHLVSTGFDQPLSAAPRLGAAITVQWPPAPDGHAAAAEHLARPGRRPRRRTRSTSAAASPPRPPSPRTPPPWRAPCAPTASPAA